MKVVVFLGPSGADKGIQTVLIKKNLFSYDWNGRCAERRSAFKYIFGEKDRPYFSPWTVSKYPGYNRDLKREN
jgi:hypothetical protein